MTGGQNRSVAQILSAMIYGEEGNPFVYDYIAPRSSAAPTDRDSTDNFAGETDSQGTAVVGPN